MTYTATTYTWNPQSVQADELVVAIYTQLLELYIFDLEVELLAEKLRKAYPPQPIVAPQWQRDPYWPQINPIWYGPNTVS